MVEIRAPFVANIDITNRCNLKCTYCYASDRENIDIPTAKCIDLINELIIVHGVFHVTIAGGEPLLHPGILRILRECYPHHGDRLVLLSNGTPLLNEYFFDRFSVICHELNSQGKPLELQISLDSHLPEIHDRNRDGGQQVVAAVERALTLPITLQLACVVTRNNVDCAHEIIGAYYPRVKNFHYMNVMPSTGRSQGGTYWDLLPSREQIRIFHQRILDYEKRYQPVRITKIERECDKEGGTLRAKGCLAGTTRIDIAPDLTVHACCMSDEVLGSLATQSFDEMWNSSEAERIREIEKAYCFKWC